MARNYREYVLERSPPWLQTASATPFMGGIGDVKDGLVARALDAVRIRNARHATDDALAKMGLERQIPRSVGETRAAYAGRLREAWTSWSFGGTTLGVLRALDAAGYSGAHIAIFNQRRYTLDADKNLVVTELPEASWKFRLVGDEYWSMFVVLFPEPWPQDFIDNGLPANFSNRANAMRDIIFKWKPGHMTLYGIYAATSAWTWGFRPVGATWGDQDRATWGEEATQWTEILWST